MFTVIARPAHWLSLGALMLLAIAATTITVWAADSIVGTWKLVSWVEEETESKAQHKNFGDNPSGVLTYTADGRMSIIFADPKRMAPASPQCAT